MTRRAYVLDKHAEESAHALWWIIKEYCGGSVNIPVEVFSGEYPHVMRTNTDPDKQTIEVRAQ